MVYTKYSDASPRTSVASKKMVPMMPGIKRESRLVTSCTMTSVKAVRQPLSSLRHWYRPIRVRIPATNRAAAAKT